MIAVGIRRNIYRYAGVRKIAWTINCGEFKHPPKCHRFESVIGLLYTLSRFEGKIVVIYNGKDVVLSTTNIYEEEFGDILRQALIKIDKEVKDEF